MVRNSGHNSVENASKELLRNLTEVVFFSRKHKGELIFWVRLNPWVLYVVITEASLFPAAA